MDYEIPEPTKDPVSALVLYYKVARGFEFDDRAWDRIHFPRCMRAAKMLMEVCREYEQAKRCIDQLGEQFDEKELAWTLETVVKHSHDWRQKRGKKNDVQSRKRFFDALAKQRADRSTKGQGELVTGGEVLNTLRNLEVFRPDDGAKERSGHSGDGTTGTGPQQDTLEAKEA